MMRAPKIGFRREVFILVPTSLLVLVVVAVFTLLSYRSAIASFTEEAREAAQLQARQAAAKLARDGGPGRPSLESEQLRSLAIGALGIALLDGEGRRLAAVGDLPPGNLLSFLSPTSLTGAAAFGPDPRTGDRLLAVAPLGPRNERRYLRIDFPDRGLARQRRSVRILTLLVVSLSAGVGLLSVLFLRHLMAPLDLLLERARAAAPTRSDDLDDIAFLIETFDNALATLTAEGTADAGDLDAVGRALTPAVDAGLLLVDTQGRVLALNAFGARLLGLSPPGQGLDFETLLAPHPELREIVRRALRDPASPAPSELTLTVAAQRRTLGLAAHPLRRTGREQQGLLLLFADRTELRKREEQERLSQNLARMGELTAGIAHEMRNSLTSLRGYLALAQKRPAEPALGEELAEIRHEADHLQRILEDFLSFARPGSVRMTEVSLESLVERLAGDPTLAGKQILVESDWHGEGPPPRIWGDEQLLERALRNVLQNAVEAEAEVGNGARPLTTTLAYSDDGVELCVDDRGHGLQPGIADRLFVPFATHKADGVGLGLALARRILELHGATLELADREGGGVRATLTFPRESLADGTHPGSVPSRRGA